MATIAEILVSAVIIGGVGATSAHLMADLESQAQKIAMPVQAKVAADCALTVITAQGYTDTQGVQFAVQNPDSTLAKSLLVCYQPVVGDMNEVTNLQAELATFLDAHDN